MPPDLDIYILTKRRNSETIYHFIDQFVDRDVSEDRGYEELMIISIDQSGNVSDPQRYDWEPSLTLSNIINRGLDYPRRSFTVYLKPKHKEIDRAMLSFTVDDQLVLGLSIDEESEKPENLNKSKSLLVALAEGYEGSMGLIAVEQPPPISEEDFRNQSENPLILFSQVFVR
jgi:hypothetical protein